MDHGSIIVRAIVPWRLVARYLWSRVMRIVSHFHPGRDGFVTPPTKETPDDGWGSSAWWGVYSVLPTRSVLLIVFAAELTCPAGAICSSDDHQNHHAPASSGAT